MATPPSDDTRILFKLISDGEWHEYSVVRDRLAMTVAPGRALRKYQERVDYARKYKQDPSYDTSATEDERIELGRRACAQITITSWKGRALQTQGEGPQKMIRLKPGFKTWGVEFGGGSPDPRPEDSEPSTVSGNTRNEASDFDGGLPDPDNPGIRRLEPVYEIPSGELVAEPGRSMTAVEILERLDGSGDGPLADILDPRPDPGEPSQSVTVDGHWNVAAGAHGPTPHMATSTRPDTALLSESEIRHVVGELIETALDKFQAGMQEYMESRFEQVNAHIGALRMPRGTWVFKPEND